MSLQDELDRMVNNDLGGGRGGGRKKRNDDDDYEDPPPRRGGPRGRGSRRRDDDADFDRRDLGKSFRMDDDGNVKTSRRGGSGRRRKNSVDRDDRAAGRDDRRGGRESRDRESRDRESRDRAGGARRRGGDRGDRGSRRSADYHAGDVVEVYSTKLDSWVEGEVKEISDGYAYVTYEQQERTKSGRTIGEARVREKEIDLQGDRLEEVLRKAPRRAAAREPVRDIRKDQNPGDYGTRNRRGAATRDRKGDDDDYRTERRARRSGDRNLDEARDIEYQVRQLTRRRKKLESDKDFLEGRKRTETSGLRAEREDLKARMARSADREDFMQAHKLKQEINYLDRQINVQVELDSQIKEIASELGEIASRERGLASRIKKEVEELTNQQAILRAKMSRAAENEDFADAHRFQKRLKDVEPRLEVLKPVADRLPDPYVPPPPGISADPIAPPGLPPLPTNDLSPLEGVNGAVLRAPVMPVVPAAMAPPPLPTGYAAGSMPQPDQVFPAQFAVASQGQMGLSMADAQFAEVPPPPPPRPQAGAAVAAVDGGGVVPPPPAGLPPAMAAQAQAAYTAPPAQGSPERINDIKGWNED